MINRVIYLTCKGSEANIPAISPKYADSARIALNYKYAGIVKIFTGAQ